MNFAEAIVVVRDKTKNSQQAQARAWHAHARASNRNIITPITQTCTCVDSVAECSRDEEFPMIESL